tara:strand:- start:585 stop:1862 length:1278 start_codon:yes stop_codon:yes gene_type:complete
MDNQEQEISIEEGHRMLRLFHVYPTARICRDLLAQYIFERDCIIDGPRGGSYAKDMREDWKKLKGEIFDHAMAIGFVAVHVRPNEVPSVVPWGMYRPTVAVDKNFKTVIRAYPTRAEDGAFDQPLRNVVVLDMFGYSPTARGVLNSLMVPLSLKVRAIVAQLDAAMSADRARAQPPIYTETIADSIKPAGEVQYDFYADAQSLDRTSRNAYQRNTDAMAELKGQQEMFESYFAQEGGATDACVKGLNNVTPLPLGQKITRAPQCEAPNELVNRMRYLEQECFSLLGVPRSFVMHDITVRHDAGMLHCTFTRTVHAWQESIGYALTYLFNVVNSKRYKKRKRTDPQAPFTVRFERMPRVGVAELNHAYDRGVMTWEAYQRQLATFCGLAPADLVTGGEPWTREERMTGWMGQKPKTEFTREARKGT